MLVLSYFLYSTLITNQIDSRQHYIEQQLALSTSHLETQIIEFKKEFPYLADIDDFSEVFDTVNNHSEKLRFRLKRIVNRYDRFVDTVYIYNKDQYYFIGTDSNGITQEGFGKLEDKLLPLQFTNKSKMLHLEGSKMLLMNPLRIGGEQEVYLGAVIGVIDVIDVIEMISNEADKQYTGEFSSKVIFTENLGFKTIQLGQQFEAKFELFPQNKQEIINNILDSKAGYLLHKLPKASIVYMTSYQPFQMFKERFGLLFVLSENDFVAPIKMKLQIIFLSFFAMIGLVIVVFIISLKDISQNNEELYQSKKSLSQTLTQQRFILEHGDPFSFTLDKNGAPLFVTDNIEKVTGYNKTRWFSELPDLLTQNKINQKADSDFNKFSNEKGFELNYNLEIKRINNRNLILEFRERPYFNDCGEFEAIVGTAKDMTDSYLRREELKRSLSILEAQQEAVKDAILITDEQNKIISCNSKLVNMFTLKEKPSFDSLAKDTLDAILDFTIEKSKFEQLISDAFENSLTEIQSTLSMMNGRFYDCYSAPIREQQGAVFGRIWTFRDVTEQKRQIKELTEANKRAQEGAKEKENFLSTMSHEIRTPLNSIVGFTNLLIQGKPRNDQEELITPLKYSADSLLGLINDILDLTTIESGNIQFENTPFNPNEKMRRAREVFLQRAEEKNVGLQLNLDEEIPAVLLGDYNRLNQILYNLLSNAIKFTNQGMIELGSEIKGSNSSGTRVHFWVKDSGIGISEKNHERIFQNFSQADSNSTREFQGTRLGLAITKKLVELQGGNMWVESELGKGAKFSFELFFGKTSRKAESDENKISNQPTFLEGCKVLVVEDNPFNQKMVEKFLANWKIDSVLVDSGEEALEKIKDKSFDIVLMDLQMPGMDGYETAQSIRSMKDPYFRTLPIVAMSADALGNVKEKVANAGMNGYLSKPFNPDDLHSKIASTRNKKSQPE